MSWAPDGQHLLAITSPNQSTGDRSGRAWLIARGTGAATVLLNVPSRIVPGAISWSPDSQHLVVLAHAGDLNALCLLDVGGEFRYLADLAPSDRQLLPLLPLAWAESGQRLLFTAPRQDPSPDPSGWLQSPPLPREGCDEFHDFDGASSCSPIRSA